MTVESVVYISDLNTALPAAGDLKSEGDDHIRNIKTGVKGSFPNLVGAASPGSMGTSLGLVGTPSYSFVGDADTGMWSPAANTLAWSVNGVEGIRLNTTGFGIGGAATLLFNVTGDAGKMMQFERTGTPTGAIYSSWKNTGGEYYAGIESSVGGIITANSTAYMYVINAVGARDFGIGTNNALQLAVTSDGRLYGRSLHNNAGAVTGTTSQYVASGTYTPLLTNVSNVSASTAFVCQWMRVGNVVTVSGTVSIDPTAASTPTQLDMSLPIASNFTTGAELGGTAARNQSTVNIGLSAAIISETVNDRASILFTCDTDAANKNWSFSFTYLVQ